ncbi:MAG: efflux RND transporter periplasmic adaptor subunit [Anaerolineales bacterium]|nr:efflux RND transporter periplasmic adaptor subunit [Anaerolineales bacterium]
MLKSNKKWIWGITGVVVLIGIWYLVWGRATADNASTQTDGTETAVAFIGDLAASATASGQVEAQRSGQLQFTVSGTVAEVLVSVGDVVAAKQPLVQLDTTDLARSVADAELNVQLQQANLAELQAAPRVEDVAAAEAAVASATAQLADVQDGASAEQIAAAEASLRAAQAEIAAAQARLSEAQGGGSAEEIAAAQYEVAIAQKAETEAKEAHVQILVSDRLSDDRRAEIEPSFAAQSLQAQANLAAAQSKLDDLVNGSGNTITANQASVAAAVAGRDVAQAQLDQLLEGPTAADIASAQATLASAEATLDDLVRGATAAQLAVAQAQVRQAEVQLAQAQLNLEKGTLVAPFAGLITAVNVSPGEQASGIVIEMVDMDSLEVVLGVDEVDVGQVAVGQTAVVTLETWPNEEIPSEVTAIEPSATIDNNGIVSFAVHLGLGETELPVLVGMTANANLVTANRDNVLLVPNAAIRLDRETGVYSVNRVTGRDEAGGVELTAVTVTIGLSDSQHTQITGGLNEGDEVALGVLTASEGDGFNGPPGQGLRR